MPAQYRLLIDHYLPGDVLTPAGTTVTEGVQIPVGWVPTPSSEPLNASAIQAFWNAGPQGLKDAEPGRDRFWTGLAYRLAPPLVYWASIGNGLWQLTGAGASLGPKGGQ